MPDPISQKIIVDLQTPFPLGRMFAQAAHASWLAVLHQGEWVDQIEGKVFQINTKAKPALQNWLSTQFTKTVCKAWGREALEEYVRRARIKGIPVGLMEEDGHLTAVAIGPAYTKDIDEALGEKVPLL